MSKYTNKRRSRRPSPLTLILIVAAVTLALIAGVLGAYFYLLQQDDAEPERSFPSETAASGAEETAEASTEETSPTQPALTPVASADGSSDSILCKASYTIGADDANPNTIVASAGTARLTNAELQVLYLSEVRAYQAADHAEAPDFSLPLDCQSCPLGNGNLSWQHYFLQQALNSWRARQALLKSASEPQIVPEEAFQPDLYQDLHGPNMAPDLPVHNFLYADQPCYKPNSMHQAYLDGLNDQLDSMASALGYDGLEGYTQQVFGSAVTPGMIVDAAVSYNTAYMYFTERSFYADPAEEEIAEYVEQHKSELPDEDAYTVDMRHILLIPEDAKVAADGKVTATEEQWEACQKSAEAIMQTWAGEYMTNMNPIGKNINFSRHAYVESADIGCRVNGGMYTHVTPGQLIAPVDEWCFDAERKPNDYAYIRSDVGLHIVFFVGRNSEAETEAKNALILNKEQQEWSQLVSRLRLQPDFSKMTLWADTTADSISMEDVLYPDIGHQRYPEAMVFLQQDYPTTSYGSSTVSRGGCGISTMAMLATFMTDKLTTPAMLAKNYAMYHDQNGTMAEMFRYVPAELGFQLEKQTHDLEEAIQALKVNKRVVSLQTGGHFTRAGHYLLLQEYYEDNDTFQVRDSNIANYSRLEGHKVDYFTRNNLTSGGTNFFIFPEKDVYTPACARCGGECAEHGPELMLQQDYYCARCTEAMSRRGNFLTLLDTYSTR